jgi:hypothetical protein
LRSSRISFPPIGTSVRAQTFADGSPPVFSEISVQGSWSLLRLSIATMG